jgi:hypothetical protein
MVIGLMHDFCSIRDGFVSYMAAGYKLPDSIMETEDVRYCSACIELG